MATPAMNKNQHLFSNDETYVNGIVELVFKTPTSINVFHTFKDYVYNIPHKIQSRIFNKESHWDFKYFSNIASGMTDYSVVYDDIQRQGTISTLKRLDILLECNKTNRDLIVKQTGLPKNIIDDSTHILVEERVVVFSWVPGLSAFFYAGSATVNLVQAFVSGSTAVLTFGANAGGLISSIRDLANSGDQFARVVYKNTKSLGQIASIFAEVYKTKIYLDKRNENKDLEKEAQSSDKKDTILENISDVRSLSENKTSEIQQVDRSPFNPLRWIVGAQRYETETENRFRNRDNAGTRAKLAYELQYIVVQQITPIKSTSVFIERNFEKKLEYFKTTTDIYNSAAVRVGQITAETYHFLDSDDTDINKSEKSIERFLRPWEGYNSVDFVHHVDTGATDKVNDFDTLPGQWIQKDSGISNVKINAEVMKAHEADLQKSALLKIKTSNFMLQYNIKRSNKIVAADVEKLFKQRAEFLKNITAGKLKYDYFFKVTQSWTFGVVRNARTNSDLTFIDELLKEFEAKIKDGNSRSNLPEVYFQWNIDIKSLLSRIIDACERYLNSKLVGEVVDRAAFTGRKSAVIDIKEQALGCQRLASKLTPLDKQLI